MALTSSKYLTIIQFRFSTLTWIPNKLLMTLKFVVRIQIQHHLVKARIRQFNNVIVNDAPIDRNRHAIIHPLFQQCL